MKHALSYRACRFLKITAACLLFFLAINPVFSADRPIWNTVSAPEIVSIEADASGKILTVSFNLVTASEGADKAIVEMLDEDGNIISSKNVGKSKKILKTVKFDPAESGNYQFIVKAVRTDESTTIDSEKKAFEFIYPLGVPEISAANEGAGTLTISWKSVNEADSYKLRIKDYETGIPVQSTMIPAHTITSDYSWKVYGLIPENAYSVEVSACRNLTAEEATGSIKKTVHSEADRNWQFTWFGQSTGGSKNTMEMVDADDLTFNLNSCTYNAATLDIIDKGGKFTAFHDGISFYYTELDPDKENFELTATFTINYINYPADGQEGFGLLVMDSLGADGVSADNHYTNSAGIIATKFEETINGTKKTSKDTLGARFVTGLTPEILAQGEAAIAEKGRSVSHAYSYDQSELVRNGDVYRITLKKTNTGYHCIYTRPNVGEDTIQEFILYGTEKLCQIDPDHIYAGFAVARGCNVTVSDVSFTVTDPATDAPAQEEPPELVPLTTKIDSPNSWYTTTGYPFTFNSNSDGTLTVTDNRRNTIISGAKITAGKDFTSNFTLKKGINDYTVTFVPDPAYVPGEHMAMAWYDKELKTYVQGAKTVTTMLSVACNWYDVESIYVSPSGDAFGKGTKEKPLDIASAISYVKPGQTILLEAGTYIMSRPVSIARGNSGKSWAVKTLKAADGTRAVLDFSYAGGGFQVWGDWWVLENIDICRTGENIKGLQIAGDHNIVRNVDTYLCGDTGCQISGTSLETFEKWPAYNLVENCTSWGNCDPAENNADGFGAKLTCGNGNVFRNCIAYNNIDDGWDLFAKAESGPIGVVLIENCIAYRNGFKPDGTGNGDGNGFKMGGDGIGIAHILRNSIAYENGATGITSNSNPNLILENVTSCSNAIRNIALYGKGTGERNFKATGVLSINGAESDNYSEMPSLESETNYFWAGSAAVNKAGAKLKQDVFVTTDTKLVPSRKADGSIEMNGLFQLKDSAPAGTGARLN